MSNDAFESCMFLKLDGGSMKMIEALQTHLALEYEFFETPADIVESAIFEMYARMDICEVHRKIQHHEMRNIVTTFLISWCLNSFCEYIMPTD